MDWQARILSALGRIPMPYIKNSVTLLLVVLFAFNLAQLALHLLPSSASINQWQLPKAEQTTSLNASTTDFSGLVALNLFGEAAPAEVIAQQEESEPDPLDAPETTLKLTLTGLVAGIPMEKSIAIIESSGKQNSYIIGDRIDGTRATIKKVFADRLIIDNRGKLETLTLDEALQARNTQAAAPAKRSTRRERSSRLNTRKPAEPKQIDNRNNQQVSKSLAQLKKDAGGDLVGKLTDYIRVSPAKDKETGALQGFRVRPGKDRQLFAAVGLKDNDLAVAINGTPLNDMSLAMEAVKSLEDADNVSLSVERDGQQYEILFELPAE